MAKIGAGIIGAGGIAGAHAQAYLAHPEAFVAGVYDVDAGRARTAAGQWGAAAYDQVEALLERREIEVVSICTPPGSHAELAIAALEAGKHVLVEKPISVSLEEADRMIEAAKRTGRLLMVGHTHRYWPANVRAKALLDDGAIGDIIMASDDVLSELRVPQGGAVPWRLQKAVAGGGVVMDNGVHAVDRIRWWVGKPVVRVFGRVSTAIDPIDVENNAEAILDFAGGGYAQVRLSFTTPPAAGRCRAEFIGTRGVLAVETWGAITLYRPGQAPEQIPYDGSKGGLLLEIEDFLACAREGRTPRATAEDGRKALEMVLAIYRSSETGHAVPLPL